MLGDVRYNPCSHRSVQACTADTPRFHSAHAVQLQLTEVIQASCSRLKLKHHVTGGFRTALEGPPTKR